MKKLNVQQIPPNHADEGGTHRHQANGLPTERKIKMPEGTVEKLFAALFALSILLSFTR